ncbi:MAG TPA: signal peptidase I [Steroidobacteraceae bacterium]|nr:signal peptidase I [Steroidobacteraceae bacterium]
MVFDFSFILVVATLVTGLVWAVDVWVLRPRRTAAAGPAAIEPVVVEYCRSFFPIILVVLLIRSFLFEPFRIPSDSMMPTLLDGDFIFVNKYTYGLRLPALNTLVVPVGHPQRGDVVVFRLPSDPSTNYIKRLVGLPGDHIVVRDKRVYVNGELQVVRLDGVFEAFNATPRAQIGIEQLGSVEHRTLYIPERPSVDFDDVVPAGHYFFMGDNRDNSRDSRFPEVGFVPAENLVGRAVRIWLNWNLPHAPIWGRIGSAIH